MQQTSSLAVVVAVCLAASACAAPQRRLADEQAVAPQMNQTTPDKASEPFWK